jgi:hypothetical protein
MQQPRKKLLVKVLFGLLGSLALILAVIAAINFIMPRYTIAALERARSRGVYETPQQGVIALANRSFCGVERVEIEQAATNSFDGSNPHVWFVLYRVYARSHTPCDPAHPGPAMYHQTYENGGVFYLNVKDGWVWVPEEAFPEVIGNWMKKLDLAGPGNPYHVPRN